MKNPARPQKFSSLTRLASLQRLGLFLTVVFPLGVIHFPVDAATLQSADEPSLSGNMALVGYDLFRNIDPAAATTFPVATIQPQNFGSHALSGSMALYSGATTAPPAVPSASRVIPPLLGMTGLALECRATPFSTCIWIRRRVRSCRTCDFFPART